ncbi:MAG: right-handed parallel beta-helix repeat-containing protein [Dehalococcoidia bacterium]|nr:right-handed parallel beta-helix repeat-containing protein [Dehalococcoidia bacterium]
MNRYRSIKKCLAGLLVLAMLVLPATAVAEPTTWYVDDSGGVDFTTIQAAVAAASAGDTVVVKDGNYAENVVVDKSITIQSENGASSTTVSAVVSSAPVFDVNASGVVIDGFAVLGPTDTHVAGIELVDVNDCTIENNDCSGGCYNGIHLGGASANNTVTGNYCHGNTRRGISVRDTAHDNLISRNTVEDNADAGFCIKDESADNVLWLNDVIGNPVEILTTVVSHSPLAITYTYSSGTYTGYLGNYYSAYSGVDADGNGVGDTAFTSSLYTDDYPLMARYASYMEVTVPEADLLWGPYVTGTTATATVINVKTSLATTVAVEYATEAEYNASGSYSQTATDGASAELHHVALSGLDQDTVYHYRVLYGEEASDDCRFRTFPTSGAVNFVVVSDTQDQLPLFSQSERFGLVADSIAAQPDLDFVLITGDLVNDGSDLANWGRFFDAGRQMLATTTIYTALGNHEDNDPLYYEIFGLPAYYSFDCGDAHFTMLDSNMDTTAQAAWLGGDLDSGKAWKFVGFHHPFYTSDPNHFGGYANLRTEWEGLLQTHGVDAVWNGHFHAYERYLEYGIHYMVVGTGGGPLYQLGDEMYDGYQNSLENSLAYASVTVDPSAETATVQVIRVADISLDNSEVTMVYPPDTVFETVVIAQIQPDWDLNGDRVCNIGDVVVIGLHWGETGDPGWIVQDLNNDGVVNIGDVVVLGLHWGEMW